MRPPVERAKAKTYTPYASPVVDRRDLRPPAYATVASCLKMTPEEDFAAAIIRHAVDLIANWCSIPDPLKPKDRPCDICGIRKVIGKYTRCPRCRSGVDVIRAYLWMFFPENESDYLLPYLELCRLARVPAEEIQTRTMDCCNGGELESLHRASRDYMRLRKWIEQQGRYDRRTGELLAVVMQHPTVGQKHLTKCATQALGGPVSLKEIRLARARLRTEGFIP